MRESHHGHEAGIRCTALGPFQHLSEWESSRWPWSVEQALKGIHEILTGQRAGRPQNGVVSSERKTRTWWCRKKGRNIVAPAIARPPQAVVERPTRLLW
jgi:hypothetical protein